MSSSSTSTEPARGFKPFGYEPVSMDDYEAKNEKAYPKEKMEKYQKVKDMIVGAENWDLHRDISNVVGPDNRSVDDILEDLEKNKRKIVKVQEWFMGRKAEDFYRSEVNEKIYTGRWKYYDRKYAEEKGIREVKCRHSMRPKTFTTEEDMLKHFDHTHRAARRRY